ncbi:MAG: hypothetical protein MI808_22670, partial [Pseudomonadales bacterium]|nr:hypothetical protein [Pseudomonadales bacterium]
MKVQQALLIMVMAWSPSLWAMLPPLPANEAFKVITIEGEDLPSMVGLPLDQLSLAAMVDGQMEPIPFQIDQYNIGGAVYFDGWEVPMAGAADKMDTTDKLLFVFKDAGERRSARSIYDGDIISEIILRDQQGIERFVYVVLNSRLRSEEQYVRYSAQIGQVETDFYSLTYNAENHLIWDDFRYNSYVGERPLDALKLVLNGGILTSIAEVELDTENLIAVPKGELIGPIRTTTQLDFVVYFMGLPILNFGIQIHHYPKSLTYDVRGTIPEFRRMMVRNPIITMSIDANDLMGATVQTSGIPSVEGLVNGKLDDTEIQIIDAGLDPHNNWIWLNSKRNIDFISYVDYIGEFDSSMRLLYTDDPNATSKNELFPGQTPNLGYVIEEFPMDGFVGIVVSLYMSDGFTGNPSEFAPYTRTLPEIEVRS